MSVKQKQILAIAGGVVVIAVAAYFLLGGEGQDIPGIGRALAPAVCPLSGQEPANESLLDRPAVAVKIENAQIAYPLSGLEKAEIVYEELVEGGVTRFMAIYGCTDSAKAGPVRSARIVDPAIMTPTTRILAFSGANRPVLEALEEAEIVQVTETAAGSAMKRVAREGLAIEHTLYADTKGVRKIGAKRYGDAPSGDSYKFGDLEGNTKRAGSVQITFSPAADLSYEHRAGRYVRSQNGEPFMDESGRQIAVDNLLVEEHTVNLSETITDVAGNPSVEIANETGSGRAVLFRDGRAIEGRWIRESVEDGVLFETGSGDQMVFKPGSVWIHLVPSDKGDVKGTFSYAR